MGKHKQSKAGPDAASGGQPYGRSGAVKTAWIIGAIAVALFVASLVQGHRGALQSSWEPDPPTPIASAPATAPAPGHAAAPVRTASTPPSASQP